MTTGKSYTTKRQEAEALYGDTIAKSPEMMNVMGDLYFKNSDVAGAPAMAERMKKFIAHINPWLIEEDKGKEVDPQVSQLNNALQGAQQHIQQLTDQAQQMMHEAQTQIEALNLQVKNKDQENSIKADAEVNKAEAEDKKIQLEILKLQLERDKIDQETTFKMAALEVKREEMRLKECAMMMDAKQKAEDGERQYQADMAGNAQAVNEPQESGQPDS